MKPATLFIILLFIFASSCHKESDKFMCNYTDFYYYQNEPYSIGKMSEEYILIGTDTSNSDNAIESFIKSNNYFDQDYDFEINTYNNYKYKQITLKLSKTQNCSVITNLLSEIEKNEIVDYAHYTIQTEDCSNDIWESIGNKCVNSYSSIFYVKVKDMNNLSDFYNTILETNTIIKEQNQFMNNWFSLIADKNSKGDALQMANYFYETGLFAASEPDIIKMAVE
jgi:hypothetical protein